MIGYALATVYATALTLQLIASAAVLGVSGVLAWIGYTMSTDPPEPEVTNRSELDDLQAETVDPHEREHTAGSRGSKFSKIVDTEIGEGTVVRDHVNLYKCKIGRNCKIDSFVYMEEQVVVGDNCRIRPFVFIPTGVTLGDSVFVGPNVSFTNDKYPRVKAKWKLLRTRIESGVSIGAGSIILPGLTVGEGAMIGAGSVVTKDVPSKTLVTGNPARINDHQRARVRKDESCF